MVSVSASVSLPLHHKVKKFLLAHPGCPGKRAVKWLWCVVVVLFLYCLLLFFLFIFSVLSQEIGWEEHLGNDLFCIEWDIKP